MLAIILNSGMGTRLGELTSKRPKCLLPLTNDETILSRQIRLLSESGCDEFMVTTGPFAKLVEEEVEKKFPELDVKYIFNYKYYNTNYNYSLYLIEADAEQDCLLLHGDLVFEKEVVEAIMGTSQANSVVVYFDQKLPEKDFKARITEGRISKIGVEEFGEDCVSLQPLYKMEKAFWIAWLERIKTHVSVGRTREYAENALNEILDQLDLRPLAMDGLHCMEIDDIVDYERARRIFAGR